MADQIYKAIPTDIGLTKIQKAMWVGTKLEITNLAYGDGNGQFVTPDPTQTQLINLVGITDTQDIVMDVEENVTWISAVITHDLPNCTIREIGSIDGDGDLVFVANTPDIDKVDIAKGTLIDIPIELGIKNSYAEFVEIPVKVSDAVATKAWVFNGFATRELDNIKQEGVQVIKNIAYGPIVYDEYMQVEFLLPPEYDPNPPEPDPDEEVIDQAEWVELSAGE